MSLENEIDNMERQFQRNHVQRLSRNECNATSGMIFSDAISGFERVADHATNIAYALLEEVPDEDED
jgi:phosphate:Na+ symporter